MTEMNSFSRRRFLKNASGDVLGARAQQYGSPYVFKNGVLVGRVDATNDVNNGRFDNFSGGTMP